MKNIKTLEDLDKKVEKDKTRVDFAIRQLIETMRLCGLAGLTQTMDEYEIKVEMKKTKEFH